MEKTLKSTKSQTDRENFQINVRRDSAPDSVSEADTFLLLLPIILIHDFPDSFQQMASHEKCCFKVHVVKDIFIKHEFDIGRKFIV